MTRRPPAGVGSGVDEEGRVVVGLSRRAREALNRSQSLFDRPPCSRLAGARSSVSAPTSTATLDAVVPRSYLHRDRATG